jgi:hypothetical protein
MPALVDHPAALGLDLLLVVAQDLERGSALRDEIGERVYGPSAVRDFTSSLSGRFGSGPSRNLKSANAFFS